MKKFPLKKLWFWLCLAALLLGCLVSLGVYKSCSQLLLSQQAAQRWRGENETAFAQISCFMPSDGGVSTEEIYSFRTALLTKLTEAGFEVNYDTPLIHDAWSATGKAKISRGQRSGEVSVTAVGGSFFDFHPIGLVSGSYLSPDDLMEDRVLLDRDCAWLLFGSDDVAGMDFDINGLHFVVAGVIERENDRFSQKARSEGMGIYMSWEGWGKLVEEPEAQCYELVLAEPVKGFALNAARDKFPIGRGEIVDNTYRYEPERMFGLMKQGSARSMHLGQAVYPYWENAARAVEDSCMLALAMALLFGALPVLLVLAVLILALVRGKAKIEDEYIPEAKERLSEAWRVRARSRWEKKHPNSG